jgi:hypothetical protein
VVVGSGRLEADDFLLRKKRSLKQIFLIKQAVRSRICCFLRAGIHYRMNRILINRYVVSGLHNYCSFFDYVRHAACLPGGFGIMVRMIFICDPHTGQVIFGRCFIFLINVLSGFTRRTTCRNLMSFLLHGWRKP